MPQAQWMHAKETCLGQKQALSQALERWQRNPGKTKQKGEEDTQSTKVLILSWVKCKKKAGQGTKNQEVQELGFTKKFSATDSSFNWVSHEYQLKDY